jgi:hypothetical protein
MKKMTVYSDFVSYIYIIYIKKYPHPLKRGNVGQCLFLWGLGMKRGIGKKEKIKK